MSLNKNTFFYKKKLIFSYLFLFILFSKKIIINKYFIYLLYNKLFFFSNEKVSLLSFPISLFKNDFLKSFLFSFNRFQNSFFSIYLFNKDVWIQLFINLITRGGKKYASYKNIYKMFYFIKKLVGINPIFILKKSLSKNRLLFDIQQVKLRKRTIIMPKLLSLKSQISKSIRYLFNNFRLKTIKFSGKKKYYFFYQKISYLFLNNLFRIKRLKKLIFKESKIIKNNFFHIKKENYLSKYLGEIETLFSTKTSLFSKKYKSFDKKDKYLKQRQRVFKLFKKVIDLKKFFLFSRFQLNLQSKSKLKSKWF